MGQSSVGPEVVLAQVVLAQVVWGQVVLIHVVLALSSVGPSSVGSSRLSQGSVGPRSGVQAVLAQIVLALSSVGQHCLDQRYLGPTILGLMLGCIQHSDLRRVKVRPADTPAERVFFFNASEHADGECRGPVPIWR